MGSNTVKNRSLIDADEVVALLNDPSTVVLYTHMDSPVAPQPRNGERGFIPGSLLFDFEKVFIDKNQLCPHMLPTATDFAQQMTSLGITPQSAIVVYDDQQLFCAPRVWWMLTALGHKHVYVLNGGINAWIDAKQPVADTLSAPRLTALSYNPAEDYTHLVTKTDILRRINTDHYVIIDARSRSRFMGTEPEPRAGVRSGHIPNSHHIHYACLIEKGRMKPAFLLREIFGSLGLDLANRIVVYSCGSGVTACILALAGEQIGICRWAVYDGSWSEWGADKHCPIE